jgi:hypothetical protein
VSLLRALLASQSADGVEQRADFVRRAFAVIDSEGDNGLVNVESPGGSVASPPSGVGSLSETTRTYGLWRTSRAAGDLVAFLECLRASLPALADVGMTAEDLRQQFGEVAGSPDFEAIVAILGRS